MRSTLKLILTLEDCFEMFDEKMCYEVGFESFAFNEFGSYWAFVMNDVVDENDFERVLFVFVSDSVHFESLFFSLIFVKVNEYLLYIILIYNLY